VNAQHESLPLPGFAEVQAAAGRLAGVVRRTPLLAGTPLDGLTGGRLLFKVESLQHTGSFKFRGAYNRLVQLDAAGRRAGVVAYSSGNHAQGVAAAARLLGIPATIVMPSNAPATKLENTRALAPAATVHGVEPEAFDDTRRSLAAGTLLRNPPEARSICDALQSSPPGRLTFAINRELLAGILTVSDAEVEAAMAQAFRHLRLVVEPGGAVALAAALAGRIPLAGRTTAVVLSGGNVDAATFIAALSR
jgi:threonine dehydratase